ncbi:MAG: MarR family transcriptional regulator [Kordiimonadaceae bacterium]|nr:MarR family transcriptional regulator [Kordiimonadaceae bacterium]
MKNKLAISTTLEVRDRCLCLYLQKAARAIARKFDDAFRPFGLTNGQFSLLMSLNRTDPPKISEVAPVLAMDRTTLTANLKPLERRGLIEIIQDHNDRRSRRLRLTQAGHELLIEATDVWRKTHDEVDLMMPETDGGKLRRDLGLISQIDAHNIEKSIN